MLLLFSLMFPIPGTAQGTIGIKAMSFNVRYDNPDDGKQNWHHRKENIVGMVGFYDPDIIGMQEVLVHQRDYLKTHLKKYGVIGVGREDGKEKGEFSPIFYKKDRFELLMSNTFWLSETPNKVSIGWDAALERIVTWAKFKERATGKVFFFMNTHFDHKGELARLESSKLLKEKSMALASALPLVITGDFNLVPTSKGIQLLTAPNGENTVVNSKDVAALTYGPDWTSCGFDHRPYKDRETIDYVFVRGVKAVKKHAVLAETLEDIFLSDHCPVLVEIEL
ncbi:endonuclease/exonuclease/phosphatase family protein [Maribacter sp. 2307ULW6-5]|uniref:endonuclease/exonuclease/phosphatase family protein n=1 Tax=Maribacter sp. 2307ULW6-5 TaxID=3386275 RepID=UPI0039BC9B30